VSFINLFGNRNRFCVPTIPLMTFGFVSTQEQDHIPCWIEDKENSKNSASVVSMIVQGPVIGPRWKA
jgi:hypothetical protein